MKLNQNQQVPAAVTNPLKAWLYDVIGQIARAVNVRAQLYTNNTFTGGAQVVTPVVLTDAASIATDASLSNHFTVTLGGNRTLSNPTNLVDGVILNWKVKQDSSGSRTLAYGSKFKWPSGTAPTLTTGTAAVDYISAQYFSDDDILVSSILKDIR